MLVAGVDDAGRGAVIGPLVIAGILINEEDTSRLVNLGVKDSKLLSPIRRSYLAKEILRTIKSHYVVKSSPAEIDNVVETGERLHRLNRLEAQAMAEVIRNLRPDIVYVDASDVLPERYKEHIAENIPFRIRIISEHKADRTYPVVSAASIIAKVERDSTITKLRKIYGDFGSGYIADLKTVTFLKTWMKIHGSYPEIVRQSWKPAKRIEANHDASQKKLF